MCDPFTIIGAAAGLGVLASPSILSAVGSQQTREAQQDLAKENAALQRRGVLTQLEQETEATAQRSFELAKAAVVAKGKADNLDVGDRSARAIGRAIGFEVGTDKATVARNQEIANETAAMRLKGIDISEESSFLQIGDTSGLALGLNIGSGFLGGIGTGLQIGGSLSSLTGTSLFAGGPAVDGPGTTTRTLDARRIENLA